MMDTPLSLTFPTRQAVRKKILAIGLTGRERSEIEGWQKDASCPTRLAPLSFKEKKMRAYKRPSWTPFLSSLNTAHL